MDIGPLTAALHPTPEDVKFLDDRKGKTCSLHQGTTKNGQTGYAAKARRKGFAPRHYCVKKLWMARICIANCCGSYIAGFSTARASVSIAFCITGSFANDWPFFCATGTNVWTAMKACSATRNPAPAMAALSPAMVRNSMPANCGSIF